MTLLYNSKPVPKIRMTQNKLDDVTPYLHCKSFRYHNFRCQINKSDRLRRRFWANYQIGPVQ